MWRRAACLGLAAGGTSAALGVRALARSVRRFELADRTVLITGGSRGLGLVVAREFARRGAKVALCARSSAELDRAREDLRSRGARVLALACDVSLKAQVDELVRAVVERFGPIDVLVNNAGVIQVGPAELMTLEDYEESMKVHFWGSLHAILAVLPQMRERRSGRIVNISSIGGKVSMPHLLPYNASKFAVTGLSEGLRAELVKDGVFVTTVCPGLMRTGSPANAMFKGRHRAEHTWFALSDSMPFLTMSAERAARRIVKACVRGESEVILTLPARLLATFHGVFPGATAKLLGLVNRLLPRPGGIGTARATGRESQTVLTSSFLTVLTQQAARRNNEVV